MRLVVVTLQLANLNKQVFNVQKNLVVTIAMYFYTNKFNFLSLAQLK